MSGMESLKQDLRNGVLVCYNLLFLISQRQTNALNFRLVYFIPS